MTCRRSGEIITDLSIVRSVDVAPVSLVAELDLVCSCSGHGLENKLVNSLQFIKIIAIPVEADLQAVRGLGG